MKLSIENYFSDWKERTWKCRQCSWVGIWAQSGVELFTELFELNCSKCDGRLAVIPYPTRQSIRQAAAGGNAEALTMMANDPDYGSHSED